MIRYILIAVVILLTTFVSAQACVPIGNPPMAPMFEMTLETQPAGAVDLGFVHVHDNHHYADSALQSVSVRRCLVTYIGHFANGSDSLRGQMLAPANRPPIRGSFTLSPQLSIQLQPVFALVTT